MEIIDLSLPCVFLGPSASDKFRQILPNANYLPPIERGQLYEARRKGCSRFLIIDGIFSSELALSPREVVNVLKDGAEIWGASSMGALRAAECWPAGMHGVGTITKLFRRGMLTSDDEVAVAMDSQDFRAITIALINVRFALRKAIRLKLISQSLANRLLEEASRLHFMDRIWANIFNEANLDSLFHGKLETLLRTTDLKKIDAIRAARVVADLTVASPQKKIASSITEKESFLSIRYTGHDPCYGISSKELTQKMVRWLFACGRYQKYIWPLAAQQSRFHVYALEKASAEKAENMREDLVEIIKQICLEIESKADDFSQELRFLEEFDAEAMRMYAVYTLSSEAKKLNLTPESNVLYMVRGEIAIAHGVRDWSMLKEESYNGKLFNAIPIKWIEEAVEAISLARTYKNSHLYIT